MENVEKKLVKRKIEEIYQMEEKEDYEILNYEATLVAQQKKIKFKTDA